MRIVLGVDDSPCSQRAIEWVAGVPWPKGTQVTVVSAARPMVGAYVDVVVPASAWSQEVQEEQQHFHAEVAGRAADKLGAAGLVTDEAAPLGDPREVLCELARTLRADLMVVGSHGRTGVSRLVLGSVASHVVTHAPCTVVVVKDHGQPVFGPKPDQGR